MVNDVRLHVRESGEMVQTTGETVNEHLPNILERVHTTTDTLAELAEDIRQLKQLAGLSSKARDENLVGYAESVLALIEKSGGTMGKKKFYGRGLKDERPAREWAAGERKLTVGLTAVAGSKKDLVMRLTRSWAGLGSPWYIRVGNQQPEPLLEWLKANHPATREEWEK
jgi:hypothetical protein